MAEEEVLGPRKTMFVLVIVVGCFAVLWPRILSPAIMGPSRDQLQSNQFDRDAGCCEMIFESEVAFLELVSEICKSTSGTDGKLSPYAASECRKLVNDTCGVDIAAFLKRTENVGKTSKMLLNTLKESNSSCLHEKFGVPVWSLNVHTPLNSWSQNLDSLKQERPIRGMGPHPAMQERGRAIPPNAPTPPSRGPVPLPHARVKSPLSVYYELDIKPPPIPGMRPPLGSPGGPQSAPKSSMGLILPVYTICIIIFFVYTLSKILFKRTGSSSYEPIYPDPQFRKRVFRDDSRSTPDTKFVVTAISGLVAEVQQQMEASYVQNLQQKDAQDNHTRPQSNGISNHNIRIIASEYKEPSVESIDETPEKDSVPEPVDIEKVDNKIDREHIEEVIDKENDKIQVDSHKEKELTPEIELEQIETANMSEEEDNIVEEIIEEELKFDEKDELNVEPKKVLPDITEKVEKYSGIIKKATEDLINELTAAEEVNKEKKQSTTEMLEEALIEEASDDDDECPENSTVKIVGMEMTAHPVDGGVWQNSGLPVQPASSTKPTHKAEDVKSIYLDREINQQSKVLVTDFAEDRAESPVPDKHLVVSGKMTLSLIQDPPRDTPERELESTVDEFTTASGYTQPARNEQDEVEESDEEIEEEIEEIEEEVEEIEEEYEEEEEPVETKQIK